MPPRGGSPSRRASGAQPSDITELLTAWRAGDAEALDQLVAALYDELYRLARRCMAGERAGHSLQPTALVNEAYLRLDTVGRDWKMAKAWLRELRQPVSGREAR
jgi:hypothetical protein